MDGYIHLIPESSIQSRGMSILGEIEESRNKIDAFLRFVQEKYFFTTLGNWQCRQLFWFWVQKS